MQKEGQHCEYNHLCVQAKINYLEFSHVYLQSIYHHKLLDNFALQT